MSTIALSAVAQNLPAVTGPPTNQGFTLPNPLSGDLRYGVSVSENVRIGNYGSSGNGYSTAFSGDLGYSSASAARPTSLVYTGGYLYTAGGYTGSLSQSTTYHSLAFSQGLATGRWVLNVGDQFSYLPQAATTGLSGVPGLGDVGIGVPGAGLNGQDILTSYGSRISNTVDGSVQRKLTGKTSLQASGGYTTLRFLDNSGGLDSNGFDGAAGLNHRLDALSSVGANFTYSRFSFPGSSYEVTSQSYEATYHRQLNRKFSFSLAGGPLRSSSVVPGAAATSSWNFGGSASAIYAGHYDSIALSFDRSIRNGSGVVRGALASSVSAVYNRALGPSSSASAEGAYTQSDSVASISQNFSVKTFTAAFQARRALSRSFSAYVSYSLQKQILDGTVANVNGYDGLYHVVGIGVTYSPAPIHLSHK